MKRHRVALALILLAAPAIAGPYAETRFFDAQAREEYAKGRYAAALRAFLQADAVTPSPGSLYNIAVCAELARESNLAFTAYEEYLRSADRDQERRADAERRLAAFLPGLAVLTVTSDPPGATIKVDREELGSFGVTPRRIALEPGEHAVTLELADHDASQATIKVTRGSNTDLALDLVPHTGTLTVDVDPPDATVEIVRAGEERLIPAADRTLTLPVGGYGIRVIAAGHAPAEADVVVRKGAESRATLVARPLPKPTGRLLVGTGVVAAEVFVDGRRRAMTPATLPNLTVGAHTIELRAKGRASFRTKVVIREGRTALVEATLTPEASR